MRTGDRVGQTPDTPIDKLLDIKTGVYLILVAENSDIHSQSWSSEAYN
jgi:hypothetical protein